MYGSRCVLAGAAVAAAAMLGCGSRAAAPATAPASSASSALAMDVDAAGASSSAAPVDGGVAPSHAPTADARSFELTVRVRGGGAFGGGVRSEPAGIDCRLGDHQQDVVVECSARFAAGARIELHHIAGGAAHHGQFHVERDGESKMCSPAENHCALVLSGDTVVTVFPISVPPPPPP